MALEDTLATMTPAEQLEFYARQKARELTIDPELVSAIGHRESGWNSDAKGSAGEIGAMQVLPDTGKRLGFTPEQLSDPVTGIDAALTLMKSLHEKYQGDPKRIAMAYNAGESAVDSGKVPLKSRAYADAVERWIVNSQDKAVDIPDTATLVKQNTETLGQVFHTAPERFAEEAKAQLEAVGVPAAGFLSGVGAATLRGPALLGEAASNVAGGEGPIAQPAVSGALQTAALALPGSGSLWGRTVSGLLQGGAAASDAVNQAADQEEAALGTRPSALQVATGLIGHPADLAAIGGAALLGYLLPGGKSAQGLAEAETGISRVPWKRSAFPGVQAGRIDRQSKAAALAIVKRFPENTNQATQEAFASIPRNLSVEVTDLGKELSAYSRKGRSVPAELQAVIDNATPEMTRIQVQEPEIIIGAMGTPIKTGRMITVTKEVPTGRLFAESAALLDAHAATGQMVNGAGAYGPQGALGHQRGNLKALRDQIVTPMIERELGKADPLASRLFFDANQTALADAEKRFAYKLVVDNLIRLTPGQPMNPEAILKAMKDPKVVRRLGTQAEPLGRLASALSRIAEQPTKRSMLTELMKISHVGGYAAIAGGALAAQASHVPFGAGIATAGAIALPTLMLGRVLSQPGLLRAMERFAAAKPGPAFAVHAGRFVTTMALLRSEVGKAMGSDALPEEPTGTGPEPMGPPPVRVPAP